MKTWDLTTLGSTMLSLTTEPGVPLLSSEGIRLDIAGAESNCAIALARLGKRVAWHSKVARTPLGERIVSGIGAHGVDVSSVVWSESGRNEQMWVEAGLGENRTVVTYDRAGAAVESFKIPEADLAALQDTTFFHVTGITPALSEDCCNTILNAVQGACAAGVRVSFDINYRAKLWEPSRAREALSAIIGGIDVLFIGQDDLGTVWGRGGDPDHEVHFLQEEFGIRNVVLTQGSRGARALLGDQMHEHGAYSGEVVSPIGAGDAFAAGVLYSLMEEEVDLALKRGCAMAALTRESRSDYVVGGKEALEARMGNGGEKNLSR